MHQRAIEIEPDYAVAHNCRGNVLKDQGLLEMRSSRCNAPRQLQPDDANWHSNVVYSMHFSPACDEQVIHAEQRNGGMNVMGDHFAGLMFITSLQLPVANRRLRIGYVSPNFFAHAEAHFFCLCCDGTIMRTSKFTFIPSVQNPDVVTDLHSRCADQWQNVAASITAELARR